MTTVDMPDGKGGYVKVPVDDVHRPATADELRQNEARAAQYVREAAELSERLSKFLILNCKEMGYTPEHAAYAISLACCNLRNDFPPANGGPAGFDQQSLQAQDYYDAGIKQLGASR